MFKCGWCRGEEKHDEVDNIFERCNLNILAMCEAKLKEREEGMFGRVKKRISYVRVCESGKYWGWDFNEG